MTLKELTLKDIPDVHRHGDPFDWSIYRVCRWDVDSVPRSRNVTGYGRKLPLPWTLTLQSADGRERVHRVYAMNYGNSGSTYVLRNGEPWFLSPWVEFILERVQALSGDADRCPACGEIIDYCDGHGETGDPAGYATLEAHDAGEHDTCHGKGCEYAPLPPADVDS